eukprot:Skav219334  [mRNA]  locus=scaffold6947:786:1919:+ [translate_table: standard]
MTLAEFLRKTGKSGKMHPKLQQRYRQAKKEAEAAGGELLQESLEEWVIQARSEGEVALAAMYNDRCYGQWVLMNVPFRNFNEEMKVPGLDLVPDHLYFQALAYLHRQEHWTNPAAIRRDLELEGFRNYHIQNILAMISANQGMIQKYLDGALNKNNDVPEPAEENTAGQGSAGMQLALEQQRVADDIVASVKAGVEQRQVKEKGEAPEDVDPFAEVGNLRTAMAVLGPAGSGKTTAVHRAIQDAVAHNYRILLTAPTGRLAATMREKFPELEIDTVHGAFLLRKPVQEALDTMLPYNLIVVEEVGQLSRANFERILEQWEAADCLPTLVFVGDFFQLPGVESTSTLDSHLWRSRLMKKHELHIMRRCRRGLLPASGG